jgi:hypothetical protein
MDTTIQTTHDGQLGILYYFHDHDEYTCYFTVDNDVTFYASSDSFDSFDEFRADIEANFDSDVTSLLF